MVFNRNKNAAGLGVVFGLARVCRGGWAGAERREGLKNPPLLGDVGLIANAIPQRRARVGGLGAYRPGCLPGAADVHGYFNLDIYYLSIVRGGKAEAQFAVTQAVSMGRRDIGSKTSRMQPQ